MRKNCVVTQRHGGEVNADGILIRKPAFVTPSLQMNLRAQNYSSLPASLPSPTGCTAADPTLGRSRDRTQSMSSLITTNTDYGWGKQMSSSWTMNNDIVAKNRTNTYLNAWTFVCRSRLLVGNKTAPKLANYISVKTLHYFQVASDFPLAESYRHLTCT